MEKMIQDLCLLLMFLTGWEEDSRQKPGEKIFRAWKGYLFEVLNKLADEKMIKKLNEFVKKGERNTGTSRKILFVNRFIHVIF